MRSSSGAKLRALADARQATLVPGVVNALAARVAEDAGFEALYVSGAGVTNTAIGMPDNGFITLDSLVDVTFSIRRISDLPIIVDGDTGFGNAVNVWHTVRTLEAAGANAIQLEDQEFPKRCGHFDGTTVIDPEEMSDKIRAACEARRDDDFMIIARTDAVATMGIDEAIRRAHMFIEAGADMTFVEAPRNVEDIRRVMKELPVPQMFNMVIGGKTPPCPVEELREMQAGFVLYANAALQASLLGMQKVFAHLLETGMVTELDGLVAPFQDRQAAVRKEEFDTLADRYRRP